MRSRESGFSLAEVVIALGLLAGVLVAVAGLFTIGGKQVRSGKTATAALASARGILEEMDRWGFRQTYGLYGLDGSAASATIDTRTNAYAQKWQPGIEGDLGNGAYGTIQLQSLAGSGTPPAMNVARSIRVSVTVHWEEGARDRTVVLGTVRM